MPLRYSTRKRGELGSDLLELGGMGGSLKVEQAEYYERSN